MTDNSQTIFVSIASYRDSELIPTLKDMIATAAYPENLHIAICWQDDQDFSLFDKAGMTCEAKRKEGEWEIARFRYGKSVINVMRIHYFQSRGAGWARHHAERLFDNERWFLQIDSHCRFIKHWDSEMIALIGQLQKESPKPLLTGYPPGYEPARNGIPEKRNDGVLRMLFNAFSADGGFWPRSVYSQAESPGRGCLLAAGFIFTAGRFVKDVPNDPNIFFVGEEAAMAVRAFTHGYDVWYAHKVLLWHYYSRTECTKVWTDHTSEAKSAGKINNTWWEWDAISKKRLRLLLGYEEGDINSLAPYTLGKERTLKEFEYRCGISLKHKRVLPETSHVSYFDTLPENEESWLERMVFSHKKMVTITKDQVDINNRDIAELHINIYNEQNRLLHHLELPFEKLQKLKETPHAEQISLMLDFTTTFPSEPVEVRICPWLHDAGWGELTTAKW